MLWASIALAYLYVAGGFCFAVMVESGSNYRPKDKLFWGCVAAWPFVLPAAFIMTALED